MMPDRPPSAVTDAGERPAAQTTPPLAGVTDAKVLAVLSLVDQLPDRAAADAMIAPLRPRLAALAPARRLTTQRLLFRPFDCVIVPTDRWQPALGLIPRGMLSPIYQRLRPMLGPLLGREAQVRALRPDDESGIERLGSPLWTVAAAHTLTLDPDGPDWAALGLDKGQRQGVLSSMALVFGQLPQLRELSALARQTLPGAAGALRNRLPELLDAASFCGLDGWTLLLNLLLDPLGGPVSRAPAGFAPLVIEAAVESIAGRPEPRIRKLLETGLAWSVARLGDHIESTAALHGPIGPGEAARGGVCVARPAAWLAELSACPGIPLEERRRLPPLRDRLRAGTRLRVEATLREVVLPLMTRLAATGTSALEPPGAQFDAVHATAIALRALAAWLRADEPGAPDIAAPWRDAAAALLDSRQPTLVAAQASARPPANVLVPQPPDPIAPRTVRFLRLAELSLGAPAALGMAPRIGWRAG